MEKDTGWSWIICVVAFIAHALSLGFSYSISVYYLEFLSIFNESKATTSMISATHLAICLGIGPVSSLIRDRWGSRFTMFIGGLITALGLFLCSYTHDIQMVFVAFGLIAGFGIGLTWTTSVIVINDYFLRLRPLALGLSLSGAGFGNICFPWITTKLISVFGWRGALMITSGLTLHICVGAMLISKTNTKKHKLRGKQEKELMAKGVKSETSLNGIKNDSVKSATFKIFSNVHFILLLVNIILFFFGVAVVYTHIKAFAQSRGISSSLGNVMVSAIGISSVIGRIALGATGQHPWINTIWLYVVAVFLTGIFMIFLGLMTTPLGMMICACVFGFFVSSFGPTAAECACLFAGPELFDFAYGYLTVVMGLGWLAGAPAAGALYDATRHYPNSFYVGGGITLLGVLVIIPAAASSRKSNIELRTKI